MYNELIFVKSLLPRIFLAVFLLFCLLEPFGNGGVFLTSESMTTTDLLSAKRHGSEESSTAEESSAARLELYLDGFCSAEEKLLTVNVRRADGAAFCGLFFGVEYDREKLTFLRAEAGELCGGFNFEYLCENSTVRCLLDSDRNCAAESDTVARLIFKVNSVGEAVFRLVPLSRISALTSNEGRFQELRIEEKELSVRIKDGTTSLSVIKVSRRKDELYVYGEITGEIGFASGFEITVIELDGKTADKTVLARAIKPSQAADGIYKFKQRIKLPKTDRFCVSVRALAFFANRCEKSEAIIYYSKE